MFDTGKKLATLKMESAQRKMGFYVIRHFVRRKNGENIYKFGKANVETEIPITEPEVDAKFLVSLRPSRQLQVKDSEV